MGSGGDEASGTSESSLYPISSARIAAPVCRVPKSYRVIGMVASLPSLSVAGYLKEYFFDIFGASKTVIQVKAADIGS